MNNGPQSRPKLTMAIRGMPGVHLQDTWITSLKMQKTGRLSSRVGSSPVMFTKARKTEGKEILNSGHCGAGEWAVLNQAWGHRRLLAGKGAREMGSEQHLSTKEKTGQAEAENCWQHVRWSLCRWSEPRILKPMPAGTKFPVEAFSHGGLGQRDLVT